MFNPGKLVTTSVATITRIRRDTTGHRGRNSDPLYRAQRTLRTRLGLLTDRQKITLETVFAADDHIVVAVTWWAY